MLPAFFRIALLIVTLISSHLTFAQTLTGSLSGAVLDSVSRQPVAYATVVLLPAAAGDSALAGLAADERGRFTLTKLAAGTFRLRMSFVGYAARTRLVRVSGGATTLPPVLLAPAAQQLQEAVIVGRKPLVEVGLDRLLYHADQDVGTTGGTARDVLRKTPLLAVDGEGNVTMRGSRNFQVLVNNKPSPTLAQNLAQALRSIPADQILSVEVIPTPPARYDGEGTAGIINIMLKKGAGQGRTGRVGISGGNRASELTAAYSRHPGKLDISATAGTGRWHEPDRLTRQRLTTEPAGVDTLRQSGDRLNYGRWFNTSLALDYDLTEHHALALAGSLSGYWANSSQELLTHFTAPDARLNQLFTRAVANPVGGLNGELTGTYTRTFTQARRDWSVLGQLALADGSFGYDIDQYDNSVVARPGQPADYRERSRGRTPSRELTVQTDYTQPLGEQHTLEVGAKAIARRTGAVATVEGLTHGQTADFVPLAGRGTDFGYTQQVQAAYATYTAKPTKQLVGSVGGRVERTALAADFRAAATSFSRQYTSFLPSGSLRYAFNDTTGLRVAYSRRITRPYLDYLNPFVDRSNPQNINFGNPTLTSEATDSYEVSYNTGGRTVTMILSGSIRHTGNAIEVVRLPTGTPGVTAQTFANIAANTFYQLTGYATAHPRPKWELSGGPNVQYIVRLSPELAAVRRGFAAGLSVDTSFSLPHKLTAQASFNGALPTPTLQGRSAANLYYAVGLKKQVLRDQAEIVLNAVNPFTNSIPYRSETVAATFGEQTEYRAYQRAFRLSLNYHFGQDHTERSRKQIINDDRK